MQTNKAVLRIASNVRAEMARRRISQQRVASVLGTSQGAVSRRLNARVPFNVEELALVAELLGVPMTDLLVEAAA